MTQTDIEPTLNRIVAQVAGLPGFVAISLGGSAATGLDDAASDLDLHVYWRAPLADTDQRVERLARVADAGSVQANILTWGLEDHIRVGGRLVELVYLSLDDLLAEARRAYGEGLIGEGFTTALLFCAARGRPLHDATGELAALRERLLAEYPEPTRRLLLQHHPDLLRVYLKHLRLAQSRGDLLSVQQRRATVQMVFFNLLFALNRRYHPGEKRLLVHSLSCPLRPAECETRWQHAARLAADDPALAATLGDLVEELCELIARSR